MANTVHPTTIRTITPKMAAKYLNVQATLEANDPLMRNRNVKEDKVKLYARDMAADKWELNGEPLIFASNGRILNGQHRLLACVESDHAFRTHIVENVAHTAMRTIDTGVLRSMGDQLTIAGKAGGNHLATALKVIWRWEQTGRKGFDWSARPTRLEMFDTLEKHPELEKFTRRVHTLNLILSPGLAGALWYIFSQQDGTLADTFFDALASGANLKEDDPVFMLRERLLRERREQAIRRTKSWMAMDWVTELVYRAWDATRRGVKITKLQRGPRGTDQVVLTRRVTAVKHAKSKEGSK